MIDLSIIIVSYNSKKFILPCLASIKRWTSGIGHEMIVVDNASTDGSVEGLRKVEKSSKSRASRSFQLIENKKNVGFAAGNNIGIKRSKGRYILLLNPDTKLIENSLQKMVDWMDNNSKVGIASCKLLNRDKTLQPTGGFFPNLPRAFLWASFLDDLPFVEDLFGAYHPHASFYKNERQLDWVTGAFFVIRREVINEIGLLDQDFFLYVEELEYCFRAKSKGWDVGYFPKTGVIHYVGKSGTKEGTVLREFSGLKLLYRKHFPPFQFFVLRILLFIGSLVRILIFAIIDSSRSKIYVKYILTQT